MLLATGLGNGGLDSETLISGGGDGTVKLWRLKRGVPAIEATATLEGGDDSVLTLTIDGTFLYTGKLGGDISVWDLDTLQMIRTVKAHTVDVLTLAVGHGLLFSGSANGYAKIFNQRYECISSWKAHNDLILASTVSSTSGKAMYITGGNDDCVATWDIASFANDLNKASAISNEQLLESLEKFVSYRTVSSKSQYAEDCRRGASWLRGLFKKFGASTEMLTTEEHVNPVVFARFKRNLSTGKAAKKILFYGHYDVIAADNERNQWIIDPFAMQGMNGYLYGRGVSDNKGPLLAALYAVADLVAERALASDVMFVVEGEEECGSRGFQRAIQKHKHIIGEVDWILLANSYWLNDSFPCLTYGLRGVIHATIRIESDRPDLHSGVDGSHLMDEALKDLVSLLSKLSGSDGRIKIPQFYDPILPTTIAEDQRYAAISRTLLQHNSEYGDADMLTASFKARWREPSLTIHHLHTSGPQGSAVIPHLASAALSLRLVPNQNVRDVQRALTEFLDDSFEALHTSNKLTTQIAHQAEPWLGNPENLLYRTLEEAIMEAWGPIDHARRTSVSTNKTAAKSQKSGVSKIKPTPTTSSTLTNGSDHASQATADSNDLHELEKQPKSPILKLQRPLYIREGGSIPAIRFLEKEFDAPAAQLPCGQASDSAHLDNERLRLSNLYKSREIFKKVFGELLLK